MGDLLPTLVDVVWHFEPTLGDSESAPTVRGNRKQRNQTRCGAPIARNDELLSAACFKVMNEPGQ